MEAEIRLILDEAVRPKKDVGLGRSCKLWGGSTVDCLRSNEIRHLWNQQSLNDPLLADLVGVFMAGLCVGPDT
jgi:hypothetical protein